MFEFDLFNRTARTPRPAFAAEVLEGRDTPTNLAPVIQDFTAYEIMPGLFSFSGQVIDENPGNLTVTFGGGAATMQGMTTTTDEYGYFTTMVFLNTNGTDIGIVNATVYDELEQMSNVPEVWVEPPTY